MLLDMHVSAIICAYGCYTRLLLIIPVCVSLRYMVIHSFPQDVDKHYACYLLITCLYTGLCTAFVENYALYISLLHQLSTIVLQLWINGDFEGGSWLQKLTCKLTPSHPLNHTTGAQLRHYICIFSAQYCQLSAPGNSQCEFLEFWACNVHSAYTQRITLVGAWRVQEYRVQKDSFLLLMQSFWC